MLGSTVLDSAVGLVVVYLLFSLVITAVQEAIASFLNLRSKELYAGIQELLEGSGLAKGTTGTSLTSKLYDHSLIAALSKGNSLPSYIPSSSFVLALLDTIVPATTAGSATTESIKAALGTWPYPRTRQSLLALLGEANGDMEKFKTELEGWFNNGMDRVSGWYKKKTQYIVLFLAMVVTVAFNVDSFRLGQAFLRDPKLRAAMVAKAGDLVFTAPMQPSPANAASSTDSAPAPANSSSPQAPASTPAAPDARKAGENLNNQLTIIDSLDLPIGWSNIAVGWPPSMEDGLSRLGRAGGWIITIFAVSLGAPFWFDILGSIMNIRMAGKVPKSKKAKS